MKRIAIVICVLALTYLVQLPTLSAQAVPTDSTTPAQLDEKTQKKVDAARMDVARDQQKLTKKTATLEKDLAKFEKDEAKGKLSPNSISKEKKAHEKAKKEIEKLHKNIAQNQAIIDKFVPAKTKM